MWSKVSIAALVITLAGGVFYYHNDEEVKQEQKECALLYKNLIGLRTEWKGEKIKYDQLLVDNEGLRNDIAALNTQTNELDASNQQLTESNNGKQKDLEEKQSSLAELQSKVKNAEDIQVIANRIQELEEEGLQLQATKEADQKKYEGIVADTEQLTANNAALRQLKADQDAHLSPPHLKTHVSQVMDDFNLVVIAGGAADQGIVPGSKLAVMRNGNKIAELDVNAVESNVSTAVILPSSVTPGEAVEIGDEVVSVRP